MTQTSTRRVLPPNASPRNEASLRRDDTHLCKGSRSMAKRRLDTLLTDRGLFSSRSRAAASVMAGEVRVGRGGRRAQKPGELVDPEEPVSVAERPGFVSRGGIKLANALWAS